MYEELRYKVISVWKDNIEVYYVLDINKIFINTEHLDDIIVDWGKPSNSRFERFEILTFKRSKNLDLETILMRQSSNKTFPTSK